MRCDFLARATSYLLHKGIIMNNANKRYVDAGLFIVFFLKELNTIKLSIHWLIKG